MATGATGRQRFDTELDDDRVISDGQGDPHYAALMRRPATEIGGAPAMSHL